MLKLVCGLTSYLLCMKGLKHVAHWLVIIGALNWGLVGIGGFAGGDWNVVKLIFGSVPSLESIIYILVGLSALMLFKKHEAGV